MTVDPTFSLGDFDVTVITYRHLVIKSFRSNEHPVFIGPVLVHYKKSFSTYLFFASTLVGLCPQLSDLKCFGTDGEEALYSAFSQVFPNAIHLLCSIHFRRNITDKMKNLGIENHLQQVVLGDLFGKQVSTHHLEGILDSENSDEFDRAFSLLSKKWLALESESLNVFCVWFQQYKSGLAKAMMLKSTRRNAGLGDPPSQFTTNASESMNNVLKSKMNYKKHELSVFVDKLKEVVDEQVRELERAIIDRGKYRFCEQFKKFEVCENKWFLKISIEQRQSHIKRVLSLSVGQSKHVRPCNRQLFPQCSSNSILSVDINSFSHLVLVPNAVPTAIWSKAKDILNDHAICSVPGGDAKDRLVKSSSNPRPHMVTFKRSGQYTCDKDCPNWESLSICSHSVASAEDNGDHEVFIEWFKKAKKSPNITKLVTTKMPQGRGRKGCVPPRKKKRKVTVQTHQALLDSFEEDSFEDEPSNGSEDQGCSKEKTPVSYKASTLPKSKENYSHLQGGSVTITHSGHHGGNTEVTVTGGTVETNLSLPCQPPPLVPCHSPLPSQSPDSNLFDLVFIKGNISVCRGCRQKYTKPVVPPLDLCIRHKERIHFCDHNGQQQARYGNVYYHCNIPCIKSHCPEFSPAMLHVQPAVTVQLMPVHTTSKCQEDFQTDTTLNTPI